MKRLLSFIAFAMMATQSAFGADRVHVVQRTEAESYTDADGVTRVRLVPKTYVSVISDVAPPPVVVKAVPVVTAKSTFDPVHTTRDTIVPHAVVPNLSSIPVAKEGVTPIAVPMMGQYGLTKPCPPSG